MTTDERNAYGCLPCPRCDGRYRETFIAGKKRWQECDDCGHKEPFDEYLDEQWPVVGLKLPRPENQK